jgi:hypothetical protein
MDIKIGFLNGNKRGKLSNKFAVFLIFVCMSVNGFIPGMAQSKKSSLFLQSGLAAVNTVSTLFEKGRYSLDAISKMVAGDLNRIFLVEKQKNNVAENGAIGRTESGSEVSAADGEANVTVASDKSRSFLDAVLKDFDETFKFGAEGRFAVSVFSVLNKGRGRSLPDWFALIMILNIIFIAVFTRRKVIDSLPFTIDGYLRKPVF